MNRKGVAQVVAFSLLVTLIGCLCSPALAYDAWVVVYTDKSEYAYFRQPIHVTGQVFYKGDPVEGGIVAIEVGYPDKTVALIRTVSTGSNITFDGQLQILSVIPCDQNGNPKNSFIRDGKAYFNVTVMNNRITSRDALMTVTICDIDFTPLDTVSVQATISGESVFSFIAETMLPSWSSTGTAKVHISVLTGWLSLNGYPYCQGKSANFTITSGSAPYSNAAYSEPINGTEYNMTFRLSPFWPLGTCDVKVGALYEGFTCWRNTTFTTVTQELGDLDFDRDIDLFDAVTIMGAYGERSGEQLWDPTADLYPSGKIDLYDAVILLGKYGKKY